MLSSRPIGEALKFFDPNAPNPYATIKVDVNTGTGEGAFDPDNRFTDYYIRLRRKMLKEYGAYAVPDARGKPVPQTTPKMMQQILIALDQADPAFALATAYNRNLHEQTRRDRRQLQADLLTFLNKNPGADRGLMLIPTEMAIRLWTMFLTASELIEAAKIKAGDVRMILESVGERLREVGTSIVHALGWFDRWKKQLFFAGLAVGGGILLFKAWDFAQTIAPRRKREPDDDEHSSQG